MTRKRQRRGVTPRSALKGLASGVALGMAGVMPLMADTDVEFSGTLVADPCQVAVGDEAQEVPFGNIPSKTFFNNVQSAPEAFDITLTECDLSLGNQVFVTFSGEKDATHSDLFAVTGTATGIALHISDHTGAQVTPDGEQVPVPLAEGDTQLTWQARVQSTAGRNVTEGDFQAVVTFTLRYE